jgi:peptidoglycan/LPS O-acetylase OafA/YrhL
MNGDKLPSLTGLRFVAAMAVVVSHVIDWMIKISGAPAGLRSLLNVVGTLSGAGMTLFFVLSGFVIHWNYSRSIGGPRGLWNFFVARFARLYPLYLFFLCFGLAMKLGFHLFKVERLEALPFYLTLTQTWLYRPIDGNALVYQFGAVPDVSWSISTEWFFYLCFPFLCVLIAPLRRPGAIVGAMVALCALAFAVVIAINLKSGAISAFGVSQYGPIAADQQDGYFRWLAYFSPYVRVFEFAIGCLVSALVRALPARSKHETKWGSRAMLGIVIASLLLQWYMFGHAGTPGLIVALHMNFGFAPFMAAIIFCCARYDTPLVRFLSADMVVLAGEASYSIYLSHALVINAFRYELPPVADLQIWFAVIPYLTLTVAAIVGLSLVLWHLIEVPARGVIRRWLTLPPPVLSGLSAAAPAEASR